MQTKTLSILLAVAFIMPASAADKKIYQCAPGKWLRDVRVPLETDGAFARVQIYFPRSYAAGKKQRTVIALHTYTGSMSELDANTPVARLADERGLVIVCPDMGKTMYESRYYPETEIKWSPVPGGKYIGEVLLPFLRREFGLALDRESTGIVGLSTGGRGALLAAVNYPGLFGAAAGISGDYDPLTMTNDRLLKTVYGNYDKNRDRWENDDNVLKMAENLKKTPVMLIHGGKDYITPKGQSLVLAMKLKQLQKKSAGYDVVYIEKKHQTRDWPFWKSAVSETIEFFSQKLQ